MKSPIRLLLQVLTNSIAMAVLCHLPLADAQGFESPPPEIVSAWKANGDNFVAVFTHEGNFYTIQDEAENPGMERGTFTWNKATQAFNAETIVDTNGDAGFSHPGAATSVSITGNTLSYTVAGEGTFSFTRVVNTTSAIVGSWYIPGVRVTLTFLGDGTYYFAQEKNDAPFGYDGIERGTYTWNPSTKFLVANAILDTNGDIGINGLPPGFTATVTGNSLALFDGTDTFTLRRITPVTAPLRVNNDFEVDKFANYRQTSDTSPALLTGSPSNPNDEFPFWGEAYIEPTVSGTGGTLTITGKPAISFVNDGGWGIYTEYTSLSSLNAALPNGANYVFARTGGSATLSYPAGGAFPPAPKIQIGEGAWGGGKYLLGSDQTLTWSPHTGYDPTTLATVISVVDQATAVEILYEDVIQGDVTSYNLSGKIEPGHTYDVQIEHVKIANSTTSGTGPFAGKLGYALYNSNTRFEMVAPDIESPTVTEQPVSQPGTAGSPLVLTVGINQEAFPFSSFQWFRNGVEIEGQTGNSLYIPAFDLNVHSGRYRVSVSNPGGFDESETALVGNVANESQGVERLIVSKQKNYQQQSASVLVDFGAGFDARVEGYGITGTFPASSITLRKPDNSTVALALDGDHWDAETDFASFSALQSAFPDGSYAINIGADSVPIDMSAASYPNQPLVTSSAGTWVNGKLRITASEAAAGFSLTTNSTTGNGFVTLSVIDIATDNDIVYEDANTDPISPSNTTFLTVAISPGLLTVGKAYEVEAEFDNVIDTRDVSQNSWAPHIANAFGLLSTTTVFNVEVVADPAGSAYTDWQTGFFNPTQLADPAISGDDVDFDNDGIDNLLEFVLGGSPVAGNPGLIKSATTTPAAIGRNLVFFYDRKTAANDISVVIETSPSLTNGTWTPVVHAVNNVTVVTTTLDANTERVTATIPSTETKLFVRLRANR